MKLATFNQIIAENKATLESLAARKRFVIGSLGGGTLLTKEESYQVNSELFAEDAADSINALLKSDFLPEYPTAVLVDLSKAVSLYRSSNQEDEAKKIENSFMMARVNFMGTDGIRGKVVLDTKLDFIDALLKDNAFTPQLVTATSFSFATMLKERKLYHAEGDSVVIGNDGRDRAYDWKLNNAVKEGFNRAGLHVIDTGVVPTAVIPWKMLELGYPGGACLTASHNPSNQNGIKFFINGAKLLPEGPLGDYVLSALMYNYCRLEEMPPPTATSSFLDCEEAAVEWMLATLPENMRKALDDSILVFDSANGATDSIGRKVLDKLGACYTCKNEKPTGDNINRDCGVAEIEGTDIFKGTEYNSHIPFVKEIFDQGRANQAGKVWGIPLDGDGDRGFLMYYDKTNDHVHVLDGDKCGYILAEYFIKTKGLDAKDYWFLSTIESDIMTASAAEKNLGLNTRVVSVGDKWIGNFPDGKIVVGLEISGHVIFPIQVKDKTGKTQTLLSGVGILTGLSALAAVKALDKLEERILNPFQPGFSKTFYVYFVDKARHFRGSAIWKRDIELITAEVEAAKTAGRLPCDTEIVLEDKEDPHVLYVNIKSGGRLLGVLFMRNSGTEDKNATYVKGEMTYEEALVPIGKKVQLMHRETMKNEENIEFTYEKNVMTELVRGDSTVDSLLAALGATGEEVSETDLFSVLHGLKKEGRIRVECRSVRIN